MKKRILSIVLAICLVLTLVPTSVFAANNDATALQSLLDSGGTVKLTQDYSIDATLAVSNTVTLDLNGHVVKMTNQNGIIKVKGGTLTLKDSNPTATHTDKSLPVGGVLTGGNAETCGGVQVDSGATFKMDGGTIYNCSQSDVSKGGGGVYSCGDFTMNSGTIKNCTGARYGGGIYIDSGNFIMNGGTIENCSTSYGGGGVHAASGNFTMNGGTIENCSAGLGEAVMTSRGMPVVANGGIIKGTFHLAPSATITTEITKGYTEFYGEIQNHGSIYSGVFYGGIQNISSGMIRNSYHTVSFDLNGGSGSAPTQYFVGIDTVPAMRPANPTREGYQFRGWLNGDNGYAFSNPVTNSVNLTAKWALSSVSTEAELLQAISEGSSLIKLVDDIQLTSMLDLTDKVITLDLNGHVLSAKTLFTDFINLYVSKSPQFNVAQLVLIDSKPTATHTDSTLPLGGVLSCGIALNAENGSTYYSALIANGGTVTGLIGLNHDNAYINYTSTDSPPTAFTGTVNSLQGQVYGGIYYGTLRESLINGKTVTFMDGDSTYAKEVVTNKAAYAPVDPKKDGYVFAGWYNGSTKYDFPQTITSDITLTAKWVEAVTSEATLRTALNEGITTIKLMADINLSSALDLSQKNITIDLNGYVISGADISINTGNGKANFILIDSNPKATHTDSTLPLGGVVTSKISMKQSGGSYNDCVLYANGGTVTSEFNTNTNAVAIKCASDTPTAFTGKISGYTHLYGGIYYGTIDSSVTVEAKKIAFQNDNNTYAYEIVDSGNNTVAPLSPPLKEGYNDFDGWYNGDTKYTFGSSLSEDITLTAKFKNPTTYSIGYILNGGTVSPENPSSYTIESEDITLNNPTKTGYTFIGWSATDLSGYNMTVTIPKGSTGNRSYTANFSQNTYIVIFDTNGGSNISDKTGVKWDDKVLTGVTNPTKAGYTFTGWKCSNNTVNANTKYSDLAAGDTVTSVTLVAQWKDTEKPAITGLENNKTYCDAVEFTVSDNDGIASVKAGDNELTATNGKYTLAKGIGTVKVVVTDKAGNTADVTVTVNNGHTPSTDDGDCETPVYCKYHPDTVVIEAKTHNMSEWAEDGYGHSCYCQNDGCSYSCFESSHSGSDDGDCTTAVICKCGYVITAANASHTFGEWQSNGNNTHTRYCTVYGCNGEETKACTGGQASYFEKAVCEYCNTEYGNLPTDTTAPTGEITVGTNKWNSFLNTITFGIFFKDTQSVTITASDDSYSHAGYTDDKAVKVEYLLSDRELSQSDLAGVEFTQYSSSFNINPDNKYVVYARLTDHAGNVTYISSNGVVLDATAPVITGVTEGEVYYTTQKAVVTDDNLKSVTLNGVSVDGTTVTLDGNTDEVYTIVATDKSDNSKTVTVTMKSISSLAESIDDVNGENVKSSDKEAIEAVKESVGEVDTSNATDSEKEALNDINSGCDQLLDIIDKAQNATETDNIKNAESISPDNVTKDNREALERAKTDLEKVLEDYGTNYTDDETAKIQSNLQRVDESLKVLDDVKAVEDLITALPDSVEPDDLDTVQSILDAQDAYNTLTDYEKSLVNEDAQEKLYALTSGITNYTVYEGNGGIWTIGQDGALTFTANGAYSKFTGIKVDGEDVDESNYTAKSGSTIITLNADYLDTLSVGTHTLTVLYTDGEAEAEFEVKEEPEETEDTKETTKPNKNESKKSPQTGNDGETALWLAFLLSCGGSFIVTQANGKRKKHSAK
ncbi:MAG: InlB B-repeat-containing protein [Eubacterium sp.]